VIKRRAKRRIKRRAKMMKMKKLRVMDQDQIIKDFKQ